MSGIDLKVARIRLGMDQREIAHLLGVTQQYISQVEKGARPVSETIDTRVTEMLEALND